VKRAFLAIGLLLPLASAALAAPQIPDGKWWKRPRIAAAVGVTPEQAAELEKIFVRTKPKLIDLKAELEKREFEFQQAMEDSNADRRAIAERIEEKEEARASLHKELALMVLDMKRVLREDQWERLTRIHRELQQRIRERRRQLRQEMRDEGLDEPRRKRR
jgi:Skp family chaperone for outer membrane proteins